MKYIYGSGVFLLFFFFLAQASSFSAVSTLGKDSNPIETGNVMWGRNLQAALDKSKQTSVPVLVLFQEIPGCIGCRNFGREVLTEPLLVEAIENEFIPVLIYNSRAGGEDEKWLKKYWEPSWNYQVIRFFDGEGEDILPRKDKVWTVPALVKRMIAVLEKSGRKVPQYLQGLLLEKDVANHDQAAFAMACFWTGEYKLGRLPGVVKTEAGWYDNREVTLVTYHKLHTTLDDLVAYAEKERCAQRLYLLPGQKVDKNRFTIKKLDFSNYRKVKASDQKKQLGLWLELSRVQHLTPMQLTKLNSYAPVNRKMALSFLSPMQREQLIQSGRSAFPTR